MSPLVVIRRPGLLLLCLALPLFGGCAAFAPPPIQEYDEGNMAYYRRLGRYNRSRERMEEPLFKLFRSDSREIW